MSRRPILLGVAALLALIAAFCTDAPVASFVHQRHWDAKHPGLLAHVREIIKLVGFFPTTLLLGIAITAIHPARWRAGLFLIWRRCRLR